ncbi:MAG TPA: hypothetical protein VHK91_04360 [Flavisolibacter sp.]|jgi:hypothetical protein|nr:hypothetical protein [Flavisolibacter sp.]
MEGKSMMTIMLAGIMISCLLLSKMSFGQNTLIAPINWKDSASVNRYIQSATLCDKIQLTLDSAGLFVEGIGYSINILQAITQEHSIRLIVPIASTYGILPLNIRILQFREQLKEYNKQYCSTH